MVDGVVTGRKNRQALDLSGFSGGENAGILSKGRGFAWKTGLDE